MSLVTPEERELLGVYYTPPAVVEQVMMLAEIRPAEDVLEPSYGSGALVRAALRRGASVLGFEVREGGDVMESATRATLVPGTDFLDVEPDVLFDAVVMNPPFGQKADIAHVSHALNFLRPGGRLVSVMWPSWRTSAHAAAVAFRDAILVHDVTFTDLPAGAFAESGTDVATSIVRIQT